MPTSAKYFTKPGPIIPPEAAPLRNLTVTLTVMCYLAALAIGALLVINRAVTNWSQGISLEVTVQIRKLPNQEIEAELTKASQILSQTKGVRTINIISSEETAKLLEPWLGPHNLKELPLPRLIRVTLDQTTPPNLSALGDRLQNQVKGASLDTHRRWEQALNHMAKALSSLSMAVLALISLSAVAMVVFATRAVLDANRHVVDVLQLIGAKDRYIIQQIDRRFVKTGLLGGVLGIGLGMVSFALLSLTGGAGSNGVAKASQALLFTPSPLTIWSYASLFAVPLCATLLCLITSRLALARMLGQKS